MFSFDDNKLKFKFEKNLSCLMVSRTLLKNDDILLEFRRTWRFLTGAGVLDHIFDVHKLKFKVSIRSDVFELRYDKISFV